MSNRLLLSLCGIGVFLLITSCSSKQQASVKNKSSDSLPHSAVIAEGKPISSMLVGTNVWYRELSEEVWELTKQSGVKSIRIGGHAYDKNMPSKAQLLSWVKKIQRMGAEPILQVSQYAPPSKAAELVKYFNIDLASGKAIKYWNIGNEPWLQNKKPPLSSVGAMVETYFKPRAVAMKSVDPSIRIYGPDFCYYMEEAINDLFGGKNDISGKVPGQSYYYCDGISWHRYPQKPNIHLAYEGIKDFRHAIEKCKAKVDSVNKLHQRTGDQALSWGLGEYNAKGGPEVHTWQNGQMFGGILALCMENEATYATSWSMFEHGGDRQGTDFSFIDGAHMTPRPSYRHMQMIAQHFSGSYVRGKSSLDDIITFGAMDQNKISVMIMNRSDQTFDYDISLNYSDLSRAETSVKLNIDAHSNISHQDKIAALTTQTLIFKNSELIKIVYSNHHFENELQPVETRIKPAQ